MVDPGKAHLSFVDFGSANFAERVKRFVLPGSRLIIVRTGSVYDRALVETIRRAQLGCPVSVQEVSQSEIQTVVSAVTDDTTPAIVVLLEADTERLSDLLQAFIDTPAIIFAQITSRYHCGNGLFVNTISKAGTHLLTELLRVFGLKRGGPFSGDLAPQTWYFVGQTPHEAAQSFFADTSAQSYGGYYHPAFYSPILFLYRHPLAILVSKARYLREQGNNSLNHYFHAHPLERAIDEIIDGPLFINNFVNSINHFAPWLDMMNVIPVSYEELVGQLGGGTKKAQSRLIWSLQLKLHIGGSPNDFCEQIQNVQTDTLRVGTIDSFQKYVVDHHIRKLRAFDQEVIRRFGYEFDDEVASGYLPRFADEFRHRPLKLPADRADLLKFADPWEYRLEPDEIVISSQMNMEFGAKCLQAGSEHAWHAQTPVSFPQWVELHYRRPIRILKITLHAQGNYSDRAPRDFRLLTKADESKEWKVLAEVNDAIYESDIFCRQIDPPITCKSIRLEVQSICGGGELLTLYKIHVQGLAAA